MPNPVPHPAPPPNARFDTWRLLAWISAVFMLAVGLGLIVGHWTVRADDPLHSPRLRGFKEKLRATPADEALKKDIRSLDLSLRQRYFRQLSSVTSGSYLLVGGVAVFLISVNQCRRLRKRLPNPVGAPASAPGATQATAARWAVGATATLVGAGLFILSLGPASALPGNTAEIDKLLGLSNAVTEGSAGSETAPAAPAPGAPAAGAPDSAPLAELRLNWPRFRGADGGGICVLTNVPTQWDEKAGTGIAWKIPSPAPGFNSPIVWKDKVFFSGGDAAKREVFCLDAKTGQIVWHQTIVNVPNSPATLPEIPDTTGFAAGTMASDGRRLYVFFANGDLAALTFEGKVVWSKGFGALKNPYGHATSLATWQGKVILELDQGEPEDGKSKLYGIDGRNGQVLWQTARKAGASWASPIVFEAAGKAQIITLAVPWIISYNAADGAELWRFEGLNGEITPSPIFAAGLVIVASPSEKLLAIKPDGQGDVTKTNLVWSNEENVPDITSPLATDDLVFGVNTAGLITCYDGKNGKKVWEHDLETECHASPSLAAGHLYVLTQKGAMVVIEAGRQYKEIARSELADAFHASPAFAPDRIILRGATNIWCLGPKP